MNAAQTAFVLAMLAGYVPYDQPTTRHPQSYKMINAGKKSAGGSRFGKRKGKRRRG